MKFQVSSTRLFNQLQAVSRVIGSKNSLPILDDVLMAKPLSVLASRLKTLRAQAP